MSASNPDDVIAKELDGILDSYAKNPANIGTGANEEKRREFLAKFEGIKVQIIKPVMENIGKYMESKGHAYAVRDNATIYDDNPSIKMEIYPRTTSDPAQEREFPKITFIAEPDIGEVGIEVQDGMPGRPGLSRGHSSDLDSMSPEYVRNQLLYLIKRNFAMTTV